ncbi:MULTISPECIES: type II toxin-antitoxin system RelE/ParE family toxin [Pirellulaceae]|uniref:Plasmid stabilization protein n=2 Tax=Pirellulaceae TaxID=2691357 RepID=A0A2G1VYI6_9BACT|nr:MULTISPECIES: type II toxin-antitoxin system RelE/ParE family toxin [Pirellulaceae]PHQ31856.1 plasmid stabilization protein [Rhodopirellula bahusiensis]SMP44541.1 Plasmid stabilization system protein ParE [Neorhodopirellula lusitana]
MPSKIYWTRQSREDLRAVRAHIARDAPATASAYVRKLRLSVGRLRQFPFSGEVVPEIGREDLREVLQGNYRIIYRVADRRVDILAVFHSARIFDERDFSSSE